MGQSNSRNTRRYRPRHAAPRKYQRVPVLGRITTHPRLAVVGLVALLALPTAFVLDRPSEPATPVVAGPGSTTTTTTTTTSTSTTTTTEAAPPEAEPPDIDGFAAKAHGRSIDVYASPSSPSPERTVSDTEATSVPGSVPMTFLVRAFEGERVRVYLPIRPNGSSGWVNESDVEIIPVEHRVVVSLSEYRIRVYHHDQVILDEPAGVGISGRPTPGGVYYIKELLQPPDPDGPYGTFAYGLSGYSDVLETFAGGPGVIGIHGTNAPATVGAQTSNGCVRLHNDVIERMVTEIGLPLGTPVEILA
jgi:lipoprotein-anchoring transpeptidase ErfK/SrfK